MEVELRQALEISERKQQELDELSAEMEAEREFFEMERMAYVETLDELQRKLVAFPSERAQDAKSSNAKEHKQAMEKLVNELEEEKCKTELLTNELALAQQRYTEEQSNSERLMLQLEELRQSNLALQGALTSERSRSDVLESENLTLGKQNHDLQEHVNVLTIEKQAAEQQAEQSKQHLSEALSQASALAEQRTKELKAQVDKGVLYIQELETKLRYQRIYMAQRRFVVAQQ